MNYLGDYAEDATLDFMWNSSDAAGASITRATDGTISVYKNNDTTQTVAGVTDTEDFDTLTGLHHCRIVLTDGFYVTGTDYMVVLNGATIDGETVNAVLAHFSIENRAGGNITSIDGDSAAATNLKNTYNGTGYEDDFAPSQQIQLRRISNTGGAVNTPATTAVITTGSETGTFADTIAFDGIEHLIEDTAGILDMYYEFIIPSDASPGIVTFTGRVNNASNSLDVFAFDWGAASWVQVGTVVGKGPNVNDELTFNLFTSHVGVGVDLGKVRIRFENTGLSSADLLVDQIFLSYTVITRSVGYSNGSIWVDTINGSAGTTSFINGTADNPVDTWANALTLAAALNIFRFSIVGGSSITLTGNSDNYAFFGAEWNLALGGQSIASALIMGATITGIGTGTDPRYIDCRIGAISIPPSGFGRCALTNTITIFSAGTYIFEGCFSSIAGSSSPIIDFGVAVGNTSMNIRHYSGGIEIQNMGQTGTGTISLEGDGQLIINANCIGGTIAIRGNFKITDNSGGAVTLELDANFDHGILIDTNLNATVSSRSTPAQVNTEVDNALNTAIPGSPTADSINERIVQIDDNPNTYKADVSGLATSADLTAVKAKTDQLAFTAGNVHSDVKVNSDKTGYTLTAGDKTALVALILSDGVTFKGADIALIRKMLTNSEVLDSAGKKTTFDDDGTTPINEKNAFDKNDDAVTSTSVDAGIPVKYTKV